MLSLRPCLLLCLLAACGPKAPSTSDGEDTSTGAVEGSSTSATSSTSTTTTLDPTTGAAGSTGEPGSGFVAPPDMEASFIVVGDGSTCSVGPNGKLRCTIECNPWEQDCPEGEKCSPWSSDGDNSWDAVKCVPVDRNPDHAGEPCTVEGSGVSGIDSCDLESMCWNVDGETMTGVCVPFCKGSEDNPICPDGTSCLIANDGVLTICLPWCDPLVQDCPDDDLCVPNPQDPNSFICVVDASGEEGQAFDACEFANACDKGLLCANPALATECDPAATGCCLPFCDLAMPACPGAMQQCLPWFEMDQAPPGLENVGVCGIPQ